MTVREFFSFLIKVVYKRIVFFYQNKKIKKIAQKIKEMPLLKDIIILDSDIKDEDITAEVKSIKFHTFNEIMKNGKADLTKNPDRDENGKVSETWISQKTCQ